MKVLSEKRRPDTRNRVEIGMSKKKGTNAENISQYGPDVSEFKDGSAELDKQI